MFSLNKLQKDYIDRLKDQGIEPYKYMDGHIFYISWSKNFKYATIDEEGKIIHFGDIKKGHYNDKIGFYSDQDHNDNHKLKLHKNKCKYDGSRIQEGSSKWFEEKYLW